VRNIPPKATAVFANLIIKEVLATASDWTEGQLNKAGYTSSYNAVEYNARKELIEYLTRSYGELT